MKWCWGIVALWRWATHPLVMLASLAFVFVLSRQMTASMPRLYSDRSGPLVARWYADWEGSPGQHGDGIGVYPARPIVYEAARIQTDTGEQVVFDDDWEAYHRALDQAADAGRPVARVIGQHRVDQYGLWMVCAERERLEVAVARVRGDGTLGWTPSIAAETAVLAGHPGLGGAVPSRFRVRPAALGDALGGLALLLLMLGLPRWVWRLVCVIWRSLRWGEERFNAYERLLLRLSDRAVGDEDPEYGCRGCGYDLRGLPTGVCPECGLADRRPA